MTDLSAPVRSAPLPPSAWSLACSCLAGQLVLLADHGFTQSNGLSVLLSVALGVVLVTWVAAGVLRARTVRLVLAWVLLSIGLVATAFEVVDGGIDDAAVVLDLVTSLAAVVSLAHFCASDYFQERRFHPTPGTPSIAGPLAVAVVVGGLAGLVATSDATGSGIHVDLRVG